LPLPPIISGVDLADDNFVNYGSALTPIGFYICRKIPVPSSAPSQDFEIGKMRGFLAESVHADHQV
jgi:hypothetical protein